VWVRTLPHYKKKGMLAYEVLNAGQLKKYLNQIGKKYNMLQNTDNKTTFRII
jgi:hypothetical protein